MIELFRDTSNKVYAFRIWRIVVYLDNKFPSLRLGGIVTRIGFAVHLGRRISFVRWTK
jgi:hypothetical protein